MLPSCKEGGFGDRTPAATKNSVADQLTKNYSVPFRSELLDLGRIYTIAQKLPTIKEKVLDICLFRSVCFVSFYCLN